MPPKKIIDGKVYVVMGDGHFEYLCDVADLQIDSEDVSNMQESEKYYCTPHSRRERRHGAGYQGAQWKEDRKKKFSRNR